MTDGGWELVRGERGWPETLEDLRVPPERLYGLGSVEVLSTPSLAVVGARRATPYGLAIAEMAARTAVGCGATVVSGGAMGCDHAAGAAALRAGGRTVVVSGCGADVVYPATSADVYRGAVERGGAIVSAERWGAGPRRWAFPKRNSLIAALSQVLVVTEAGIRSGTMSTAEAAAELGRTVYAIPGSIFSPESAGTNRLISEGASVIADEQALSVALSLDFGHLPLARQEGARGHGPVVSALLASPSRPEELAVRLGEDVLTILRTLTDYEARGIVERLPDGRYSPTRTLLLEQNRGPRIASSALGRQEGEEHGPDR